MRHLRLGLLTMGMLAGMLFMRVAATPARAGVDIGDILKNVSITIGDTGDWYDGWDDCDSRVYARITFGGQAHEHYFSDIASSYFVLHQRYGGRVSLQDFEVPDYTGAGLIDGGRAYYFWDRERLAPGGVPLILAFRDWRDAEDMANYRNGDVLDFASLARNLDAWYAGCQNQAYWRGRDNWADADWQRAWDNRWDGWNMDSSRGWIQIVIGGNDRWNRDDHNGHWDGDRDWDRDNHWYHNGWQRDWGHDNNGGNGHWDHGNNGGQPGPAGEWRDPDGPAGRHNDPGPAGRHEPRPGNHNNGNGNHNNGNGNHHGGNGGNNDHNSNQGQHQHNGGNDQDRDNGNANPPAGRHDTEPRHDRQPDVKTRDDQQAENPRQNQQAQPKQDQQQQPKADPKPTDRSTTNEPKKENKPKEDKPKDKSTNDPKKG